MRETWSHELGCWIDLISSILDLRHEPEVLEFNTSKRFVNAHEDCRLDDASRHGAPLALRPRLRRSAWGGDGASFKIRLPPPWRGHKSEFAYFRLSPSRNGAGPGAGAPVLVGHCLGTDEAAEDCSAIAASTTTRQ